ncbi:MAG TPA: hypothetical protein VHO48_16670, partial [Anaerolineaceae bacterium]|nr:hypothetical protein [Anaerolineaceae bacterium]
MSSPEGKLVTRPRQPLQPANELLSLRRAQLGFRVHQQVNRHRHFAFAHDLAQFIALVLATLPPPLRKIQLLAPFSAALSSSLMAANVAVF